MKKRPFERRRRLIDAALDEFSENSFGEASINRILKSASISKGVFYYHFRDKKELYICVMNEASETKWEFISSELKDADLQAADIFEQFRLQARAGIRFSAKYPKYQRFARMLAKEKDPNIRMSIENGFTHSEKIAEMVGRAQRSGDFSSAYTGTFLITVIGFMFGHFDEIFPDDRDAFENLDSFIGMMKSGLGEI
jgi:TetR/AcrR family transcriptional regulator